MVEMSEDVFAVIVRFSKALDAINATMDMQQKRIDILSRGLADVINGGDSGEMRQIAHHTLERAVYSTNN